MTLHLECFGITPEGPMGPPPQGRRRRPWVPLPPLGPFGSLGPFWPLVLGSLVPWGWDGGGVPGRGVKRLGLLNIEILKC